jgi:hypothetical protein
MLKVAMVQKPTVVNVAKQLPFFSEYQPALVAVPYVVLVDQCFLRWNALTQGILRMQIKDDDAHPEKIDFYYILVQYGKEFIKTKF